MANINIPWADVGHVVASFAPEAGSILGGLIPFPGGALIGQKFGEIIAKQFGVAATPDAVKTALANASSQEAIAKIQAATEQARAEIDGFTAYEQAVQQSIRTSIEQTNQTMRVELLPENQHWFYTGWRPAAGWVLVWYMACFGGMLLVATGMAVVASAAPLTTLSNAWPIFAAYFGALGLVVGVYMGGRSVEKAALIAAAPPVVTTTTTTKVAGPQARK